ncbi:single-stranded-DNA-specific exonuclease RecJ [Lysinibacillus xylanilyticus]|uniref:Single-stranded-DNA-specific exonuclease RecJ n=1 Tax=Lysinibacillus xylanilyticus TaxID=582475 RepID=A0ABV3W5G7_9BACI
MNSNTHTIWKQINPQLNSHPKESLITYLARQTCINPILMHGLYERGINTEEQLWKFLYPSVNDLHDPYLLNDLKKSVYRIIQAMKRNELILIFGDYDVDGISSATLLYNCLHFFGANVLFRLPLRHEGYGISPQIIEEISTQNVSLIITVDNGSSAHEAMRVAKEKGIEVIVTDHHEILGKFPDCYAFINPKRFDNKYPYPNLSGAGVALKLVQAIFQATSSLSWEKHYLDYIEMATLGTIADLMPLDGENRIICSLGLRKMNSNPHPVLKKLFDLLYLSFIDSTKIGFQIAPIFNAVGRIDDPNKAVKVLINPYSSEKELKELIAINKKRQLLTNEQYQQAERNILINGWIHDQVIVVHGDFHSGIIGIIASRISENFQKPSVVISQTGIGSARTVQGSDFSIINPIKSCSKYLTKFGGHQGAAGLSIEIEKIDAFRKAIQLAAMKEPQIKPLIQYTSQIDIKSFPNELFYDLSALEPFGIGNPKPIFYCPTINQVKYELFGKQNEHIKLSIQKKELLAFSKGRYLQNKWSALEFLYTPNCLKEKNFLIHDLRAM